MMAGAAIALDLEPVLIELPVRGWSFYVNYDTETNPPRHGEPLVVVPEPQNPVDAGAIQVCLTDRPASAPGMPAFRCGYLPKEATPFIHALLAADSMAASGERLWPGVLGVVPGAELADSEEMMMDDATPPSRAGGTERRWITMTALLQVRVDPASGLARTLLARWGLNRVQPSRALKMDGCFPSRTVLFCDR